MDIRRAALIASVATTGSVLLPMWNAAQRMAAVDSMHPQWWITPLAVIVALFAAILPVFYYALYRNEERLRFSRHLRLLAIASAFALGLTLVGELLPWIASRYHEGTGSVLLPERGNLEVSDISVVFGILSNAAIIFTMIAVYRHVREDSDAYAPVSTFLRVVTSVAVIAWGSWVAFNLCRLVLTPYSYVTLRGVALQIGRTPPPFRDIFAEAIRTLLSQAGLFAGPYIIWRSSSPSTR